MKHEGTIEKRLHNFFVLFGKFCHEPWTGTQKNVYFSLPFCGGPKMPGVLLMKTSTFLKSQISKATSVKCCIEGFNDTALVLKNLHYGIDGLLSLCLHPDSPKSLKSVSEFQKFFIQIFVSP